MSNLPVQNAGNWWWCLVRGHDGQPTRLIEVESDRYPDGSHLELTEDEAAIQAVPDALCTAVLAEDGTVQQLAVAPRYAAKAPSIWFVEVDESEARPPAVSLVAFTGGGVAPGSLLVDLSGLEVSSEDQLGAVRWYPATGETDQLYVQPNWRRRNVAASLLAAGEMLSVARGWPRFWADGQRTEMGEVARNGRSWKERTADLTHLHPPMTPGP